MGKEVTATTWSKALDEYNYREEQVGKSLEELFEVQNGYLERWHDANEQLDDNKDTDLLIKNMKHCHDRIRILSQLIAMERLLT